MLGFAMFCWVVSCYVVLLVVMLWFDSYLAGCFVLLVTRLSWCVVIVVLLCCGMVGLCVHVVVCSLCFCVIQKYCPLLWSG